jgi:hypothetical protein
MIRIHRRNRHQTRAGVRTMAEEIGDGIYQRIPDGAENFLALHTMLVIGIDNFSQLTARRSR